MTSMAEQVERIQWLLQDTDNGPTRVSNIIDSHKEAVQRLARNGSFPGILWINATAGQSQYTLPDSTFKVGYVFYNEQNLKYATEAQLDRRYKGWEARTGEPKHWTMDNQDPNTIRIIPPPVRTGSVIPVIPSPLPNPMPDNIVVFLLQDLSEEVDDISDDPIPTMLDHDDWLVWRTAMELAAREDDHQNLPVAEICKQLAALWEEKGG